MPVFLLNSAEDVFIDTARITLEELCTAPMYRRMETNAKEIRTTEQLYALRKQAVRLHRKGLRVMQIVAMTGLSWPGVRAALDRYEAGGMAALKPAVRGKKPGTGRRLTGEQEQGIRQIICDKRPEQLKMEFALWSRAAVGQLIEREYGLKLQVRTVGKYLARWGFTPQKPIKKAYEQRPEAVKKWLDEEYPMFMVQRTQRRASFKSSSNCCSRSGDAMNPKRV